MGLRKILRRRTTKEIKQDLKVQEKQNLEIRDNLAMERTKLANERTFLAYMRTAMAMVLAGLTFIKVFEHDLFYVGVGIAFIPAGLAIAAFGYYRFAKKKREVARRTEAYTPTSPVHAEVAASKKADATAP